MMNKKIISLKNVFVTIICVGVYALVLISFLFQKIQNADIYVEDKRQIVLNAGINIVEKIEKYAETGKYVSAYLIDELIYEMGDELPCPVDFFDMQKTVQGNLLSEDLVKSFLFETELTDEMLHKKGKYIVKINCNGTLVEGHMAVVDTSKPVISVPERSDYFIGDTIYYKKNVVVTDNSGEKLEVMIDNSAVMNNVEGAYQVYYSAIDSSGNIAKVSSKIVITQEHEPTEDEVNQLADEVLTSILEENMTKLEQTRAIFEWCYNNIRYTADADKSSLIQGAYDGIHHRMGDCFTYYATGAYLMNRCGIENLAVSRKDDYVTHYWSLVNVGEGWYHFDCSPHRNGYKCFMQTDAQVKEYAQMYEENADYFVFDEAQMPERSRKILMNK